MRVGNALTSLSRHDFLSLVSGALLDLAKRGLLATRSSVRCRRDYALPPRLSIHFLQLRGALRVSLPTAHSRFCSSKCYVGKELSISKRPNILHNAHKKLRIITNPERIVHFAATLSKAGSLDYGGKHHPSCTVGASACGTKQARQRASYMPAPPTATR